MNLQKVYQDLNPQKFILDFKKIGVALFFD